MWTIRTTDQFDREMKRYGKKRPNELGAVLHNVKRYHDLLAEARNSRLVQAGFMHPESMGIIAIDQKGGGSGLQETRLYTYADDTTQTLWLITLGNKQSQPTDIQSSRKFVASLQKPQGPPNSAPNT